MTPTVRFLTALRPRAICLAIALASLFGWPWQVGAQGPLQRVPNATLAMPPSPPTSGYTSTNAFGTMVFTNPVNIVSAPGDTNRLFIVERAGRIVVITNLAAPTRTIFMDITDRVTTSGRDTDVSDEQGLLGLVFHPGYATNRLFYVFYTGTLNGLENDILASFQISDGDPNQGDPASAVDFITQLHDDPIASYINHHAGDLHFGPDGCLYVSLGDGGGAFGQFGHTQRIDQDFFSAILRIDVNNLPGNLPPNPNASLPSLTNYSIPADNPFVGATTFNGLPINTNAVRTEFWAVGMRNPWRFTFDEATGDCYLGHVGQSTLEWIDLVSKGANMGWNYFEGYLQWTNSSDIPAGFVWTPPLTQYGHTNGRIAVIGGIVYHGSQLPQLYGAYLYGDLGSGEIFALRHSGATVTENTVIMTDPSALLATFGTDPSNGDPLYAALHHGIDSTINRIIYDGATNGAPLPPTLADTGVFTDPSALVTATGIVPYNINVPFWSDNAIKTRWFSIPNTNLTIGFNAAGAWSFPTGTVWIKHFELQLTNGVPASNHRLETRLLVKNAIGVYGVTYRWGDSLTNATLVPESGMDESFVLDNGGGILCTQVWHYPSRAECLTCHSPASGYALGFTTAQLNHLRDYGSGPTNEIGALSDAGYFDTNVTGIHLLPALAAATNTAVSLEFRVRSYLAANCSQCHQPATVVPARWDARLSTPTPQAGIINGPLVDNGGSTNNHVVTPGSLANSILFSRVANLGPDHMPPLATSVVNAQAVALLAAWITNDLPSYQSFPDWQIAYLGSTNSPNAAPYADPDGDGAVNYLEYLTGTDPNNAASFWSIGARPGTHAAQIVFQRIANRAFEVQGSTNLSSGACWTPLDIPGNEPFFSVSNCNFTVTDVTCSNVPAKYYRVRVYPP
jgi:glucose/arabinose dehydrogenase